LNLVGLKRAGYQASQIAAIKQAYLTLYRSGLSLRDALARIEAAGATPEALHMAEFIRRSERGICRERARQRAPVAP
jgi:UDP-N-acetylglucosamine acyltransferase